MLVGDGPEMKSKEEEKMSCLYFHHATRCNRESEKMKASIPSMYDYSYKDDALVK
jgi:hypothetical protein